MRRRLIPPLIAPALITLATLAGLASAEHLHIEGPDRRQVHTQASLLALEDATLRTQTPWTDGELRFGGASLATVLASANISGGWLEAEALNGYSVTLPVGEVIEQGAFVAVSIDGEPMRVKDKGPFWIVFPWSERPDLLNREVRAWSIWQVTRLKVVN